MGEKVYLDDLYATRAEYLFKPPAFVTRFLETNLNDVRDMEIAYTLFNILVTMYPALVALYTVCPPSHLLGVLYFATFNALYLQRFILAMHYSTHRRLFKPGFYGNIANKSIVVLIAPLFGIPSNYYWLHHIVMHHVDNNEQEKDLSSTEGYQRDNLLHWFHYFLRFILFGWIEMPVYAAKKRRWGVLLQVIAGLVGHFTVAGLLWSLNPVAAKWTVLAPYVLVSAALMFGNWSQHSFVCPENPRCNFRLAINVVNHPDNQRSFNDGFHVLHHVNSQIHWTDFPSTFVKRLEEHAEKDTLVFHGIGFFDVGVAIFLRRYGWLADRYVNIGQKPRTREEVIELLKDRVRPVERVRGGVVEKSTTTTSKTEKKVK